MHISISSEGNWDTRRKNPLRVHGTKGVRRGFVFIIMTRNIFIVGHAANSNEQGRITSITYPATER